MARATGIGGVFFRSRDTEALRDWYSEHLGLQASDDGVVVIQWGGDEAGSTVWSPFPDDTDYFGEPSQQWMVNYRVDDRVQEMEGLGRFGWATDPEGNRFELWEPAPGC